MQHRSEEAPRLRRRHMRSIWKGHIRFSLVTIPIRVYNAIDSTQAIRFNQLHREDNGPVGYDKRCKVCEKTLTNDEIVKGYQYEPDQYVIVEKDDIDKVKLKTTKIIEIQGFVNKAEINPTLYDAAYYLGPDGDVSTKPYALLRETLSQTDKLAVGKVVLRDREDVVAIAPQGDGLVAYKLHYASEVRDIRNVPQLDKVRDFDESALGLARSLVATMATSFSQIDVTDRYGAALKEFIQTKIEGREIVVSEEKETPTIDIMTALKESIEQAKSQRSKMVKATGEAKKPAETEAVQQEEKPAKARKRKAS
ncbi:MAG: Ku protein [Blastocatellia bacterium AA13]|nr:MAG: Ku protein [Blastocatellia bacterium AA13]